MMPLPQRSPRNHEVTSPDPPNLRICPPECQNRGDTDGIHTGTDDGVRPHILLRAFGAAIGI